MARRASGPSRRSPTPPDFTSAEWVPRRVALQMLGVGRGTLDRLLIEGKIGWTLLGEYRWYKRKDVEAVARTRPTEASHA